MSKNNLKTSLLTGALFLALMSSLSGQIEYPESKFDLATDHLFVDYAYFRAEEPGQIKLDIYYQVHHRGLSFSLDRDHYTASYELIVRVEDNDHNVIKTFTRDRRITIRADEEARTRTDFRTSQISLDLTEGKYKLFFRLTDRTSRQTTTKELKVKLDNLYHRRPRLSSIEFAQAFQRKTEPGSVFAKGDMLVVPSVHRVYGSVDTGHIVYYVEVYAGSDEVEKLVAETRIRHHRKGMLYRDTLHLHLGDEPERQLREISLAHFVPGDYELEITLRGRRNKQLARRLQEFTVAWTQEGMIRNDWKTTVNQLKLFSADTDVGDMAKLKQIEERVAAFDQFWRERDPTEGTAENEAKRGFYHRIRVANKRFGIMRTEGWKTDRGRTYILYGEPDYMDDEPFSPDRYPYQIWHFISITPNRHFLFVDENQDGDYRLQYPFDGLGGIDIY